MWREWPQTSKELTARPAASAVVMPPYMYVSVEHVLGPRLKIFAASGLKTGLSMNWRNKVLMRLRSPSIVAVLRPLR